MRRRSKLPLQQELDDRRFRYRARFEYPPGEGNWNTKATLYEWLDNRLGKDNYGWHPETWNGYGAHTYLLHFDDYTIIADLLKHYRGIFLKVIEPPKFSGNFTYEQVRTIRAAIFALQSYLVERLDNPVKRVVWTLGRASIPDKYHLGRGAQLDLERINDLIPIDTALSVVPTAGETAKVTIQDRNRGALEVGLTTWKDAHPAPDHALVAAAELFLCRLSMVA